MCPCLSPSQKSMRAKEYECFVAKIQRLENLCRALQEERNVLYKKIKEAQFPGEKTEEEGEEEDQAIEEDSLGNEAGPGSSVTDQADELSVANEIVLNDLAVANEDALKDLATAFVVTHHMEMPLIDTNQEASEESHDLRACSPLCFPEPALPSHMHQDTGSPCVEPMAPVQKAEQQEGKTEEQPAQNYPELQLLDADMEGVD